MKFFKWLKSQKPTKKNESDVIKETGRYFIMKSKASKMKKSELASRITTVVWNTFARKRNANIPYYSAVNLEKAIEKGIKEHIENEIKNAKFPKKSVYEISYLDVAHNQFKVKMFNDLPIAIEWMRYMELTRYTKSRYRYIACNFQDDYDACNRVPF